MDELVQEGEEFVEEAREPIGEQGAAQAVEEDVVVEEETTQEARGPQRYKDLLTCFIGR